MLSGGLEPGNVAQALAITRAPRSMCRRASSAGRARRIARKDRGLHPRGARQARCAAVPERESRAAHDHPAAQLLPHRPGRERAFRHLWRPLRRRDADAADPRSGKGLCRRPKNDPAFQKEMDGYLTHYVGRPSAALFRRAPDRAFRRRENLFQARGAQPHRRAQGEQRARPDPAGAPHGQEAHHRRNRRRHAWRRHRDAVRALRARMRRLHGRGRCRAAEAECVSHEDAGRRGACRCSPARRP